MRQEPHSESPAPASSAAVYERFRERMYRYILRLVKNPAEAEDLVQETFLRVHKQLPTLRDPAQLKGWLYRIATNVSYDRLRQSSLRQKRTAPRPRGEDGAPENDWPDGPPRIDEALERSEMSACVQEFVSGLSDDYRAVLLLHDVEGLTHTEIAEVLECSLHTAKIRLHRARKKLKAALDKGCDFSRDGRGVFVCDPKSGQ